MSDHESDKPVRGKPETIGECLAIAMHPAFRIGFLDARAGRRFDHDCIMQRILAETPASALKRLGWTSPLFDDGPDMFGVESNISKHQARLVELAQYRYEEGRILFLGHGVRCKAWGHPDFPPAGVRAFCIRWIENKGD